MVAGLYAATVFELFTGATCADFVAVLNGSGFTDGLCYYQLVEMFFAIRFLFYGSGGNVSANDAYFSGTFHKS